MRDWSEMSCVDSKTLAALTIEERDEALADFASWDLSDDGKRIRRSWLVANFVTGIDFFMKVAEIAERENHHPDLHLCGYRNLEVEIWTHTVDGLSVNDFILAAKIDKVTIDLREE